jgi:hypothetical protein
MTTCHRPCTSLRRVGRSTCLTRKLPRLRSEWGSLYPYLMGEDRPLRRPKSDVVPTVSRCLPDGTLIELLYYPEEAKTAFAVWRGSTWTIESHIDTGGELLVPFSPKNNIIKNEVVLLPTEPNEFGSKGDLLRDIRQFIHRYLDVAPGFEDTVAHYVLLTWVYDAFNEVPYLRFQGDFGTGKTRALLVIGSICCRAFFASGASTVSPIFHILDAFRGTLIFDEADFRFSDEKSQIVKILNNGNVRGMPVLRTMQDQRREFNPRAFHVFGPKVVATRGAYDDRALESRFLTEVMGRAPLRADIPINLPAAMKSEALALRNKLLLYRFHTRAELHAEHNGFVAHLAPRLNQVLTPLLSIIENPEAREALVGFARAAYDGIVAERGLSTEAQLLEVVRELAATGEAQPIAIGDIANRFAERFGTEYTRPITPRWVGAILRRCLHLSPHKSHGRYVLSVSDAAVLAALYGRYGLSLHAEEAIEAGEADGIGGGHGDVGTKPG